MSSAMVALATITLGSSASTITFGSIPATYRDLRVIVNAGATGVSSLQFQINGDGGANYSRVSMTGNGSIASSSSATTPNYGFAGDMGTTVVANSIIDFMDYSATDKHKTILARGNQAGDNVNARAVRWAQAGSTITSIVFSADSGASLIAGSTFSLFGILA